MALNEKHNGQNQQKWLSRAMRERIDLSASVEETLEDPNVEEVSWAEDLDVLDEQVGVSRGSQAKNVFPPRLSLQSRPIPAVQATQASEAKGGSDAIPVSEQERGLVTTTQSTNIQNTNMLKRFAQRLTSSFAALGMVGQPAIVESSLQDSPRESGRYKAMSEPFVAEDTGAQAFVPDPVVREEIVSQPPAPLDESESHDRQGKQRLAGRTTRIHLETPPIAATMKARQSGSAAIEGKRSGDSSEMLQKDNTASSVVPVVAKEKGVDQASLSRPVTSVRPEPGGLTNPSLPAITRKPVEVSSTSKYLPATNAAGERERSASRRALSGTGAFEPGQGEAIVVNRHVTEASVVLVTLTANPGPVVVQYVTLRPRIGFTVHLTAPSTMRASFNYIVLLGELF